MLLWGLIRITQPQRWIITFFYIVIYHFSLKKHHSYVIMSATASQITGVSIVCLTVGSGADQRKHQSSASLAFVWGIHWWPVNSPHKRPVTPKMFPFDAVIMKIKKHSGFIPVDWYFCYLFLCTIWSKMCKTPKAWYISRVWKKYFFFSTINLSGGEFMYLPFLSFLKRR